MKKIFKKIIGSIGIVFGILGFSACGGNKDKIKIGVPNDGTNQSRAIKLLESAGLIEVDSSAGYTPELKDITKYIYNIEIVPTAANTLPSLLDDYAACVINGTYATPIGLVPSKDALIIEKQEEGEVNPYVNIIVARTADKDKEIYKKIVDAYHTPLVAEYLLKKYNEAFYPAFDYESYSSATVVEDVDGYSSSKTGKEIVKVGVCGASNEQWKAVQKVLDENGENIYIELVEFSAYNLPNEALNSGDIDLNAFQHKAYLDSEIEKEGYAISAIGDTLIAPLSLYSNKADSLEKLKNLTTKTE